MPRRSGGATYMQRNWCPSCRRTVDHPVLSTSDAESIQVKPHSASKPPLLADDHGITELHPPLIQGVFDIETFGLDRGWGVMLCADILVHGAGEPKHYQFAGRDYPAWREGRRSDDSGLARDVINTLAQCHVIYAHNGDWFDVRWLRTLALKWDLPWSDKKLVDPCALARKKYAIGNNSLSALAAFLDLPESKMPVPMDVWRKAIFDDDSKAWDTLQSRCASDVRLLNAIAARITRDVGMIDKMGSWR